MSNLVKVKDVIERVNTKEDRFNTDRLYYVGGEHFQSGALTVDDRGIIKGSTIGPMFYYGFKANDFLLVSRNPHLRKAGLVNFDGICSEKTFVLHTKNESILLQKFIPFIFQNERFWKYAIANKHGSTNFFVNWSTLADYSFELPSIEQQKAISKLLWALNDTKKAYEDLIQKTDELVKSQFIEMFGRPGQDDKGWGLTTLGKCCELNPRSSLDIDDDKEVSFVPMPAVSEHGQIDAKEHKPYREVKTGYTHFEENDVLFAKITPCMENGKGAVAKDLINGVGAGSTEFHVLRPIPGKSNPYWLYELTMLTGFRDEARSRMTGTGGQLRVPIGFLEYYPISLPPIDMQNVFEAIVEQSDKSKFELNEAIKDLDAMYKRIIKDNLG